ncbi:hypothetical protein N5J44_16460 [Acinetobacter ursingii]|uniref:hypothetical protein n=1 Tax=Acinetobacter ursingii TaxID=108980 RepID=UPI00244C90B2|nr:hypothetical protein [Acinetobacter ursingii]MDH2020770.1 hypothetical protein [Acinetobacter ursingii]MDH2073099.1 hypothetical protein [Acinetobacter ursingii]
MNKGILATIIFAVVMIGSVFLYYVNQKQNEATAEYLKSEISDKDYYSLVVSYNYVNGSMKGEEFKESLKSSLSDGIISRSEYKKLTGDKADISIYEKPEYKKLYKDSKQQLVKLVNGKS